MRFTLKLSDGQKMVLATLTVAGVSVLLALAIGLGEWQRFNTESAAKNATFVEGQVNYANVALLEARRSEKDFLLRKDLKYVERINKYFEEFNAAMGGLEAAELSQIEREEVTSLKSLMGTYRTNVKTMTETAIALGLSEKEGLQGKLRDAVHHIEETLDSYNAPELDSAMLMLRRREKDFILREDTKYIERLAKDAGTFRALLQKSGNIPEGEKAGIRQQLEIYEGAFNRFAELTLRLAGEKKQISAASHAIEPVLDELGQNAKTEFEEVTKAAADYAAVFRGVLAGLLLVSLLTGVITLWWLNRSIRRSIGEVVVSLSSASESLATASEQVSSSSQALASGSSEQAANLEEASSTLEEISTMTKENATNTESANDKAKEAQSRANDGGSAILRMVGTINEIKSSSDETAKIIKTIDEIAFQTNLLALNAAVEAARAGDAGRGFAVVAEEVRNLAMRSAEAAKSTSELIDAAQVKAEAGVHAANDVESAFNEITTNIQEVSELMGKVTAASKEQTAGVEQVSTGITQLNEVTQNNAANAEETAGASQEMASQAEVLNGIVLRLASMNGGGKANGKDAVNGNGHGNGHGNGKALKEAMVQDRSPLGRENGLPGLRNLIAEDTTGNGTVDLEHASDLKESDFTNYPG